MKIAYYCTGHIWQSGGGATVLKNILSNTSGMEHELHLFVSSFIELADDVKKNYNVHLLKTPRSRTALEVYDQCVAPFILFAGCYDRVICLNSIVPILYPKRMDVYFQMRMFYFEELNSFSKKLKNFLGKLSIRRSRSVYVASADHKSDLVKHLNMPAHKYKVVNLAFTKPIQFNELIELDEKQYFVFISVIRPYKNLERLITAYIKSCSRYGDMFHDLYVIGAPADYVGMSQYMDKIRQEVDCSVWSHKIHFLGAKTHNESMTYLAKSKALVFPTLFEGFGLPLLEGMALGVPVIVSNRNSLPEVGGDTVRYFDPENIQQLESELAYVYEGKYSPEMVASAKRRAEKFNWSRTAKGVLNDCEYKV